MKILDCTLRDGGYYTNWDFNNDLVKIYFESLNQLPIDYLEIGYRSKPLMGYYGEFFYSPVSVLEEMKQRSCKKLAIMIDEKNTNEKDIYDLLIPAKGLIEIVRIAVNPLNIVGAVKIAETIKKIGFEIGFNVMYMSKWKEYPDFLSQIKNIEGIADYFYMVDSYGGVYPNEVKEIFDMVRSRTNVNIGFHGHNNLELGLINTLTAIECGVDIVDATITGMGRGAGNLKTELLLTALNAKSGLDFNFNALSKVVDSFSSLQEEYKWGTSMPYMVSGANSLPQKDVMEWMGKRFYSFNSIIRSLTNKSKGISDNIELSDFNPDYKAKQVLIIGGGEFGTTHAKAVNRYLANDSDITVIHVSSKNVKAYEGILNKQIHCISGNEGYRLEGMFKDISKDNRIAILPPSPRVMGTYLPSFFKDNAFQINKIDFTDKTQSVTALAIQIAINLGVKEINFVGYDGYRNLVTSNELELFNENKEIFAKLSELDIKVSSLTPTMYSELAFSSIYASISTLKIDNDSI